MAEINDSRNEATPAQEPQESTGGGAGSWITGVFLSPGATFAAIRDSLERPHPTDPGKTKNMSKWWLPIIITMVVGIGVALYTVPTFIAPMQEDAIRESVLERGGTEAEVQQAMNIAGAMIMPSAIIGVIIVTLFIILVMAFVTFLLMKMLGGKGGFKHAWAIAAWTSLITTLGSLVKLPLMIARKSMIVETGPSLFFKDLEPSDRLFKFLSGFDIFTIWAMIVTAIAIAVVYRVSRGKAWTAVAVLWILALVLITFSPGGMGAGM
jgi:hypothetical protein